MIFFPPIFHIRTEKVVKKLEWKKLKEKNCLKIPLFRNNTPKLKKSVIYGPYPRLDLFYFDEHHGWNLKTSQEIENHPDKICLKFISQKKTLGVSCYIAYSHETKIHLFKVCENEVTELEGHDFSVQENSTLEHSEHSSSSAEYPKIEHLKFIGTQLLGVSENSENMAVWNAARQGRWQQHKVPEKVLCLESVSTFVYLGSEKGRIHYTDLEKFPLRTKDNSLLVTELHSDPLKEPITGMSLEIFHVFHITYVRI